MEAATPTNGSQREPDGGGGGSAAPTSDPAAADRASTAAVKPDYQFFNDDGALVRQEVSVSGAAMNPAEILRRDGTWVQYPAFDRNSAYPKDREAAQAIADEFATATEADAVDLLAERREVTDDELKLLSGSSDSNPYDGTS